MDRKLDEYRKKRDASRTNEPMGEEPGRAGPTLRARLNAMVLSAIARGKSLGPTCKRTDACHAGPLSAVPHPTASVKNSSVSGVIASI